MTFEIKYKPNVYLSLGISLCFHLAIILCALCFNIKIKNKTESATIFSEVLTNETIVKHSAPLYSSMPDKKTATTTSEGNAARNNNTGGTQELVKTTAANTGGSGSTVNTSPLPGSNIITADGSRESINVNSGSGKGNGTGDGTGSGIGAYGTGNAAGGALAKLPFIPRQILEVLPQNNLSAEGEITVHLKINTEGKVKEYKIVKNTSSQPECLGSVLKAVYKSRWESVIYKGSKIEYWVEKTYTFNK